MIIDTHIHLDNIKYIDDLEAVLSRAREIGVKRFIIPGADIDDLKRAVFISQRYEDVYFSVGVHPYDAQGYNQEYLIEHINHPKCVAVGECGLDYYRLPDEDSKIAEYKRIQKEVFVSQIELAKRYNKPLIVHIRDASRDSKQLLLEHGAKEIGGVLHCFNADEELLSLVDDGFYFGIGGVLTFKNAKKLVNILPKIPQDRLLLETDGPYLTPHPYRGERNEPAYTDLVATKMSELLKIDRDKIDTITTQNAHRLFNIR